MARKGWTRRWEMLITLMVVICLLPLSAFAMADLTSGYAMSQLTAEVPEEQLTQDTATEQTVPAVGENLPEIPEKGDEAGPAAEATAVTEQQATDITFTQTEEADETNFPEITNPAETMTPAPEEQETGGKETDESVSGAPENGEEAAVTETPIPENGEEAAVTETPVPESGEEATVTETPVTENSEEVTPTEMPTPENGEEAVVTETSVPESSEETAVTETPVPESTEETAVTEMPAPENGEEAAVTETPVPESSEEIALTETPETEEDHAPDMILNPGDEKEAEEIPGRPYRVLLQSKNSGDVRVTLVSRNLLQVRTEDAVVSGIRETDEEGKNRLTLSLNPGKDWNGSLLLSVTTEDGFAPENFVISAESFDEEAEDVSVADDPTTAPPAENEAEMENPDTMKEPEPETMVNEDALPTGPRVTLSRMLSETYKTGELVLMTAKLEGAEDAEEVLFIWEVNKGEGWEEADRETGGTYSYPATAETLGWDFRVRVLYR